MMDVPQGRWEVPDALFATDNALGIPVLDITKQGEFAATPFMPWGATKRNQRMPGVWHFYTDDYRYEALWRDPTPLLRTDCRAAIEPNFTTSEQMPFAVGWYQIYRKRWIARYWQEHGVSIFVDMNVAPAFYHANLCGVPYGWKKFATHGYKDRLEWLDFEYDLACERRGGTDIDFVVYGGSAEVEAHCQERASLGYLYMPEIMDCRKGKRING